MGFNSVFKGLNKETGFNNALDLWNDCYTHTFRFEVGSYTPLHMILATREVSPPICV